MSDYPETLDLMMRVWNTSEPTDIRALLDQALSPEVRFVDPSIDLVGIDAFEKNVHEVHKQVKGGVYSRTSEVNSQHNFHRYHWAIHQNDQLLLEGFDVTETDETGKVKCVIGFFGPLAMLKTAD